MERIHNILYILTVLLMYLHFVFVLWVPTFIQCLYLASIFAAPVRTRSIQVNLPVSSTVTLSHQTSRVEAMLLLKLWTEQKWTGALPDPPACVGNSWIQCDLLRNVTAEGCQSPVWQVCQLILSPCKLEPAPTADPPPQPHCHASTRSRSLDSITSPQCSDCGNSGTLHTYTATCTHCSMKDSTGQFLCAGYWHCISTYCLVWHLPVKGPQTSDKSCCQVFIAVENFPLFAVDSFLIKK